MHAVAVLALFFGFMGMMLLDGQVFTHAVIGIVCGLISMICGVALVRRSREPRWTSWVIVALGFGLSVWSSINSPSAYRSQQKFNNRSREHREKIQAQGETPPAPQRTAAGANSNPRELLAVQGDWQFNEAAYLDSLRAVYKEPEERKKMIDIYEFGKKNGAPVMTDITISGSRITTSRGLLQQQYDVSDYRTNGGRIVAKALWHEDRSDPGDASTVDVILQTDGTNLSFTVSDGGSTETYRFRRK